MRTRLATLALASMVACGGQLAREAPQGDDEPDVPTAHRAEEEEAGPAEAFDAGHGGGEDPSDVPWGDPAPPPPPTGGGSGGGSAPTDDAGPGPVPPALGAPVGRQTPWASVGVNGMRTCAVDASGGASCWGTTGEYPNFQTQLTPLAVTGLSNAATVVPGGDHACAILTDTTVQCWGANERGQLGDGSQVDRPTPVPMAGLANVVHLVLGGSGTAVRRSDGAVFTAGEWHGYSTGLFLHRSTVPHYAPVYGVATAVDFAVTGDAPPEGFAASSGEVLVHVDPGWLPGMPAPPGVRKLAVGSLGILALLDDGTVARVQPGGAALALFGLNDVRDLVAGWSHACALAGGQVVCWGSNVSGELGDGTKVSRDEPAPVTGLSDIVGLAAHDSAHTCAVRNDGAVFCWGANSWGQLGDGTKTARSTPVQVVF